MTHQPPPRHAWDDTRKLCLEKKQLPTMHFSPGRLKSRLSCTTPEAQEVLHTGGVGVSGISPSPMLAFWCGLEKPWLGKEGAGKGLGPSNRAQAQFLRCVLRQLIPPPTLHSWHPGFKFLTFQMGVFRGTQRVLVRQQGAPCCL